MSKVERQKHQKTATERLPFLLQAGSADIVEMPVIVPVWRELLSAVCERRTLDMLSGEKIVVKIHGRYGYGEVKAEDER